jgi:aminopeptidase N
LSSQRPPCSNRRPASVDVTYGGQPNVVRGERGGDDGGWFRTESGGAFAAGEPISASAWYPVNEHPADTATFAVTATVPDTWQVISNGLRQTDDLPHPGPGKSIFRWKLDEPVASYLTTIYIDKFSLVKDTLPDGKPIVSAIGPNVPGGKDLAMRTKKVIAFLSGYFGPYPFESVGGIFTGQSSTDMDLETATRPVYSGGTIDSVDTEVHELSHQWFGDDVTIKQWSDICINECFASYAPWLWKEQVEGTDLDGMWKRKMTRADDEPDFWSSPLVDMGPGQEFTSMYDRGPLAMHALRKEIGDDAF